MKGIHGVIHHPVMTEKSQALKSEANKVVLAVDKRANKIEIRQAVEQLFSVKVTGVATMVYRGKDKRVGRFQGRRSNWKKAIVTLKEGTDLDVFGSLQNANEAAEPS
jgi:large subunit ribosomal protein L23